MKVLVDTNVLLSAALRDRLPERVILHVASSDQWLWLVTEDILDEYVQVLQRPKFALRHDILQHWIDVVQSRTIVVSRPPAVEFTRDPKDAPFLAAAIAFDADYLITGDKDLFTAQPIVVTRIVSVGDFAALFQVA